MLKGCSTCLSCGTEFLGGLVGGLCPKCVALSYLAKADGSIDAEISKTSSAERQTRGSRFSLIETIGKGGMGEVFAAMDPEIGRTVAVKRLHVNRQEDSSAKARFLAEARITGQLEHPGIVPVYDVGVDSADCAFYIMRRLKGVTLAQIIAGLKSGDVAMVSRYSLAALLIIFQKVCDAVAYAHSRGIVHRDLKPENIMAGEFGEVVVMDWGLAKVLSEIPAKGTRIGKSSASDVAGATPERTLDDVVMGSPGFMAPEQADGRANQSDQRTDVFALGAILYSILTLTPPIVGRSSKSIIDRTKSGVIRPPAEFNKLGQRRGDASNLLPHCPKGRVPVSLSAVAMKALALDPSGRYSTVQELQADIAAYQNGFPTTVDEAGFLTHLRHLILRRKKEFTLVAAALSLIVVMAVAFVWRVTAALKELQSTAPSFAAEARALLQAGNLTNALEKIRYAAKLAPREPEHRKLEGDVLQVLFRFEEATKAYRAAVALTPGHSSAEKNIRVSEELARAQESKWTREQIMDTLRETLVEQGRFAEAVLVARDIDSGKKGYLEKWKQHLLLKGFPGVLTLKGNGLELDANHTNAKNLIALAGMPLTGLNISSTQVMDLSPLRGMPLIWLNIEETGVSDLTPLSGMPLENLNIAGTKVTDLSPLKGMRLLYLTGQRLAIKDLTPLSGMPLRYLNLHDSREISDIRPLAGMMLHHLDVYHSRVTDLSALRGMPLGNLNITATPVSNIEALRELPVMHLGMEATRVGDIRPLSGLALTNLILRGSPIKDITPIQGMPLITLMLDSCFEVEDLTPIASCRDLVLLTIPPTRRGIETLRGLRKVRKLSYSISNSYSWEQVPSTEEFWQRFDSSSSDKVE
jgi:serine/threonine protein kinase